MTVGALRDAPVEKGGTKIKKKNLVYCTITG